MRGLDETDLRILSLLAEDARRPFSEIGEQVGLSGPAVSDRVDRLRAAGVLEAFTVKVDRSTLGAGVPVLVAVEGVESVGTLRERLRKATAVDHVFVTADGGVQFYGRATAGEVREWVDDLLDGVETDDYRVTLVDEVEWTPSIEGVAFALTCAECDNTVDSEGETVRLGDDVYHFCCGSCRDRFERRYRELEEGA